MNILFTSKGRIIFLLFLICHFGFKLRASASIRMVCDTDTTAKQKAKKSVLQSDTTLVLKAGSTILRNADTILIINGVPTKLSKSAPGVKPDEGATNMAGDAKADSVAKGLPVSAPSKIATIVQPTEGTIQVRDNGNGTPTNTTIVAPPSDGVIQMRSNGTPPSTPGATAVPVPGALTPSSTVPGGVPTPGADGTNPSATSTSGEIHVKNGDSSTGNAAGSSKTDTILKRDTTNILKHDTTTILKTDTVFKRDTTTIIKRDTVGKVMDQDTTDASQIKAKNYYLGVGGAGLAISINYDSRFNDERNGFGYQIGVGGFVSGGNNVITVPFQINYLMGEHSSMLEIGGGTTFLSSRGDNKGKTWEFDKITGFVATGSIGYRYQPEHKGLSFRIAFVPILYDEGLIPAGGISIGYTFK